METNTLLISDVFVLPSSAVFPEMPDVEILEASRYFPAEKIVPGSAVFSAESKPNLSGQPYSISLSYVLPFPLEEKESDYLLGGVGAVVVRDLNGRRLVLHKNDWVQNTPPRATLSVGASKTSVTFSMSSLNLNFYDNGI